MRTLLSLLLAVVVLVPSAWADGLFHELPEDGTWALYEMHVTLPGDEEERKIEGTLKIASVGKVTENDVPCRWIELRMDARMGDKERTVLIKVLVPEKHLGSGKKILSNRIRGWIKMPQDNTAEKLTDENLGPLPAFFADPLQDARQLEPVEVESKLGTLACKGVSGYTTFTESGRPNRVTFETRLHAKAPFGTVASKMLVEVEREGELEKEAEMTFTLKDMGTEAKSELKAPDPSAGDAPADGVKPPDRRGSSSGADK